MPEITDGVEASDRIVLSDAQEAIPSSTNAQRINGGSNLTGGSSFRGGTRPPADLIGTCFARTFGRDEFTDRPRRPE